MVLVVSKAASKPGKGELVLVCGRYTRFTAKFKGPQELISMQKGLRFTLPSFKSR